MNANRETTEAIAAAMRNDQFLALVSALGTLKLTELLGVHEACRVTYGSTWQRHTATLRAVGLELPKRPMDAVMNGESP